MDEYEFSEGRCVCCGQRKQVLTVTITAEDRNAPEGYEVCLNTDPICLSCIKLLADYQDGEEE